MVEPILRNWKRSYLYHRLTSSYCQICVAYLRKEKVTSFDSLPVLPETAL